MKKAARIIVVIALTMSALTGCLSIELIPGGPSTSVRQPASSLRVGNNETIRLEPGVYEGTLSINANNATLIGTGIGRTMIQGRITINGNTNEIRGVTIIGSVTINGNSNDLSRCDLSDATVAANGNNNRY